MLYVTVYQMFSLFLRKLFLLSVSCLGCEGLSRHKGSIWPTLTIPTPSLECSDCFGGPMRYVPFWRRPARSPSLKLLPLYRGLAPDTKPWVEGFHNLHPTLILAQGILTLTKSGFTQILTKKYVARRRHSLSPVRAQIHAGKGVGGRDSALGL